MDLKEMFYKFTEIQQFPCAFACQKCICIQQNAIIIFHINIRFLYMKSYYAEAKFSNASEQQDYYFLQPMFEKLPPNEIISEKYAPDVATQVKLMTSKDERRNNVQFVPPKIKNMELETYGQLFSIFDYLGKQYTDKIHQIVYIKFNNTKYNLMPEAKLKTRVMPAFYVPFSQIYSQTQSLFTKNMGLNFPESSNHDFLPSVKYNRGCSFDPIFCSAYESANLFAVVRKNPYEYDLILQNDTNSCQQVNWLNFSVEFAQEGYYSFKIVNLTEDMAKIYEKGMKICYYYMNQLINKSSKRNGEGWGLCGENIKFTKSSIEREDKKCQQYYELYFEFKCKNKHDIIMFALDVPYSTIESQRFFNKILLKKFKNMIKIEKNQYGKTISGSPLVSYLIKRKKIRADSIQMSPQTNQTIIQNKDKRKSGNLTPINRSINLIEQHNKSIVILGRINGSDISSSFIIEGMVDYLLDSLEIESMKRVFDFHFIPLVNIDAVKYGNSVSNLTGSLLNHNWKSPNKDYQAEIFYLKEYLQEINKESPISLILNLTTQRQEVFSSVVGVKNDNEQSEDSRIFPFVLSKRYKYFSFQKSVFYGRNENSSMCCVLNELYPKSLIYELKVSQFQATKRYEDSLISSQYVETELKQSNPQNYRAFGKDLLSNYLQHVKLYDKNLLLRDKWVKQIDQIEGKLIKRKNIFVEDQKVEEKFPQSFYQIHQYHQFYVIPEFKTSNALISNKFMSTPKLFDIDRISKDIKTQKSTKNSLIHSGNEISSKRYQIQGYLKANLQMKNANKLTDSSEIGPQKPISLFRLGDKKTSILLNCPSNTLNFEVEGDSKLALKINKKKDPIQKEILKKELSTKLLRKVKIEDTLNKWKAKGTIANIKSGQFLMNS